MKKPKKLSEAEWELMLGVWSGDTPVTVRELHARLYPDGRKAYTTVQTILNILVDKGFLARRKIGMVNFYTPVLSKREATRRETRSLVSRLFHGSFGELAHHLIDSGELSEEDLAGLKALIEQKQQAIKSTPKKK